MKCFGVRYGKGVKRNVTHRAIRQASFNHTFCTKVIGHSHISTFGISFLYIYCYGRYCVRRSVSPQVPENPSGPLVDNFIVLPCVAFGVTCVKLLPGVDLWNSLDEPRVIGPCHSWPLRSVGVAPSLGRFWLVFAALKLRYVLRRHIILSDSDGNQAVLDCFTVSPGLGGSAK